MTEEPLTLGSMAGLTPNDNLVLRQSQGMRREMAAMLERQDRTQQLIVRLDRHMEALCSG